MGSLIEIVTDEETVVAFHSSRILDIVREAIKLKEDL
jgi:hypothetical protein